MDFSIPGAKEAGPGFQGSEHSGAKIIIYQHGDDPIVLASEGGGAASLSGLKPTEGAPSLFSASTQKALESASGTFSFQLKPSTAAEQILRRMVDNDWVDVIFYKHNNPYHVMRGLVDDIKTVKAVSGSGATTKVYAVQGRDFGKIWEDTPIWFSPYGDSVVSDGVSREIFKGVPDIIGSPAKAVEAFIFKFFEALVTRIGINYSPPKGMPGILINSLVDSIVLNTDGYQNIPARINLNPNAMCPQGMLWDLAYQYSDPMFTELYVDMTHKGDPFYKYTAFGEPSEPKDTVMTVILRDKPFPALLTSALGFVPAWNKLPTVVVNRQELILEDTARTGRERFNCFLAAGLIDQETQTNDAIKAKAPLMDQASLKRHGLRRMDVQAVTAPDPSSPILLSSPLMMDQQRALIRDWYCMNPYLYSGTLAFGHGRPDIKIGFRARIPGKTINPIDRVKDMTYYVESVGHSWSKQPGLRTTLGVTRGWEGDDTSYMTALAQAAAKYTKIPLV